MNEIETTSQFIERIKRESFKQGEEKEKRKFLDFLETLFKPDEKGEPYQYFKAGTYQTKYLLFMKIEELKKEVKEHE